MYTPLTVSALTPFLISHSLTPPLTLENQKDVALMEPRVVIKDAKMRDLFIEYWTDNLPDVSERPEIVPKQTQFWMMEDNINGPARKTKKRYPKPHSTLPGLRGKTFNDACDFTISCNKWCATFKDNEGITANLVDECIVCTWLFYVRYMVCYSHPVSLPDVTLLFIVQ